MLKIGLTGGIGTGKSLVARLFKNKGALVVDFDELAHNALEPGTEAWRSVANHFGPAVLNDDGTISRKELGIIVFSDKEQRNRLNGIVHPAVFAEWKRIVAEEALHRPESIVVADVPLLFETNCRNLFDVIVLVYSPPERQIERVMSRNSLTRREIQERLAAQIHIDEKIPLADYIIDNTGPLAETERAVADLWEELVKKNFSLKDKKGFIND
ncbi:MAG: dephospho-CoA kinase [Deltaproteobacteria bacterium]|nr:dephospho-CoA kinase [Deltaproteobacteria bacterium]